MLSSSNDDLHLNLSYQAPLLLASLQKNYFERHGSNVKESTILLSGGLISHTLASLTLGISRAATNARLQQRTSGRHH